jgi:hypothetical protein
VSLLKAAGIPHATVQELIGHESAAVSVGAVKARFSISVAAVVVCFFPSGESEPIKANPARAAKMKKMIFKLIKLVLFYAKYPGADF